LRQLLGNARLDSIARARRSAKRNRLALGVRRDPVQRPLFQKRREK
jgi:hypothetical protein